MVCLKCSMNTLSYQANKKSKRRVTELLFACVWGGRGEHGMRMPKQGDRKQFIVLSLIC